MVLISSSKRKDLAGEIDLHRQYIADRALLCFLDLVETIMAGSPRRRRFQRQRERHLAAAAAPAAPAPAPAVPFQLHRLPPELQADIHHRLAFVDRLAFASACGESGQLLRREAPWLILPAENVDRARVMSVADGKSATVRTFDVAMRGHVAIGSSGGWLVTADDKGALRMANPATGAHADLPAITAVPFIKPKHGGHWFSVDRDLLLQVRFGGLQPLPGHRSGYTTATSYTVTAAQMRQVLYRKVVLSESPRPNSYAAMLIMERSIGAPAFAAAAAAEDREPPSWRAALSADGVEDAIHHDGRFLSITYTGRVEAWQRDAATGEFTGEEVAPRLAYEDIHLRRKYIAASPDGRLMAVLKHAWDEEDDSGDGFRRGRIFFKVQLLDRVKGRWEEAADIGDAALFVGVNGSLCLSTKEHQGIRPGCVYFTDDEVGAACLKKAKREQYSYGQADDTELRDVGVYCLEAGRVEPLSALGLGEHQLWPPPAWFTPSFL